MHAAFEPWITVGLCLACTINAASAWTVVYPDLPPSAVEAWSRMASRIEPVHGSGFRIYEASSPGSAPGTPPTVFGLWHTRFWLSGECAKFWIEARTEKGDWLSDRVFVYNNKYAFAAERSSEDAPYATTFFRAGMEGARELRDHYLCATMEVETACSHVPAWNQAPMNDLVQSLGFKLLAIGTESMAVAGVLQESAIVEFEFSPAYKPTLRGNGVRRSLSSFRNHDWRILRSRTESDDLVCDMQVDYPEISSRFPSLLFWRAEDPRSVVTVTHSFHDVTHAPIPHDEFTMMSIGLDEPSRRPNWVLVGGGLAIATAGAYMWVLRTGGKRLPFGVA